MYAPPNQYIPQCTADRRPFIAWSIVAASAALITGLIIGAPLAKANGFALLSFPIYQAFSHVCHQAPERSFFVAGHQLAVCARCTGLYLGFAAAVICYPLITSLRRTQTPERKWLVIGAAPLAIDSGLGLLGLWENTHLSRFSTGALLGSATVFYIMPGLAELSMRGRFVKDKAPNESRHTVARSAAAMKPVAKSPSDYSAPFRRV